MSLNEDCHIHISCSCWIKTPAFALLQTSTLASLHNGRTAKTSSTIRHHQNLHGTWPMWKYKSTAVCMKDGVCSKRYPKPFQPVTTIPEDGYPLYMRPDDGRLYTVKSQNKPFDAANQWIIPYNPFLSSKFHCHINVESVASFKTLKYCFKYIHKGPDRATIHCELAKSKLTLTDAI